MSASWMLATLGVWSFGAMVAIGVVLALAHFVEETWRGSVINRTAPHVAHQVGPERLTVGNLRCLRSRHGWFGWLAWLGMWCGVVGAVGLFVGVPWAAVGERSKREAREAVERELVRRYCGDLLPISLARRTRDGIIRQDREMTEHVAPLWRQYVDCRDRVLARKPRTSVFLESDPRSR
jgi:hypothetical protein